MSGITTSRRLLPLAMAAIFSSVVMMSCSERPHPQEPLTMQTASQKPIIYQVFTRLFGNKVTTNKPWGTIEENGVGKFSDINDAALDSIKAMGVTHIWYTGIPHHASVTDYSANGIPVDDPDVVKGRAGSPYAVRDYYNVDPDLADDPEHRLAEFEALVARTHRHDMKVIIDIVPNHVARDYHSLTRPQTSFGLNDNVATPYQRDNNFYYVPDTAFEVPDFDDATLPLGGEAHPLADGKFDEFPARWTGNGARTAKPDVNDWYETVKINYGVTPDGNHDFVDPDASYASKNAQAHYEFWQGKDVPDSWVKVRDIALYWLDKGVDGFRYDMAEMVPVAFWSYLNSHIKHQNPDALLLAEVYQPDLYRDYLYMGKMDYLYDKVDFYDSLKRVMQETGDVAVLDEILRRYADIDQGLLHFLENHDEQRIASAEFAGDAEKGKPALVVSALTNSGPLMIYFGQEVGEDGSEDMGFGKPSRTTIFDYAGVPAHQRWMNDGKFDGGQLSAEEKSLRQYYQQIMNIAGASQAVSGEYQSLLPYLSVNNEQKDPLVFAFARWEQSSHLISVSNFYSQKAVQVTLTLPDSIYNAIFIEDSNSALTDKLTSNKYQVNHQEDGHVLTFELAPLQSVILE